MMSRAAWAVLLLGLSVSGAEAGVVRQGAKAVKATAKVASQPARHPVKDAKAVGRAVRVVIW